MSKMQKLYRIDLENAKTLNIGHFNPTCKAILKAMYRIEKQNSEEPNFKGSTGDYILQFAVKNGLWFTRQVPEKYHTTWAYYVKKLKDEAFVFEAGALHGLSTEEYLDQDEFLEDEPNDEAFDEDHELHMMETETEEEPQLQAAE